MKKLITYHSSLITNKAGFTLIEALIAVLILAIGLLGVALMQVSTITGNTFSREMDVATELAQDMLETIRASTYTAIAEDTTLLAGIHTNAELKNSNDIAQPNPIDVKGMATDSGGNPVPLRRYTRTWTVTDDVLGPNMKTIVVDVTWQDSVGTSHGVTLQGIKVQE